MQHTHTHTPIAALFPPSSIFFEWIPVREELPRGLDYTPEEIGAALLEDDDGMEGDGGGDGGDDGGGEGMGGGGSGGGAGSSGGERERG